nr:unnamed protein product [Callosobruchus analis]
MAAVAVVALLETTLGILFVVERGQICKAVESSYDRSFDRYDENKEDKKRVDLIQVRLNVVVSTVRNIGPEGTYRFRRPAGTMMIQYIRRDVRA